MRCEDFCTVALGRMEPYLEVWATWEARQTLCGPRREEGKTQSCRKGLVAACVCAPCPALDCASRAAPLRFGSWMAWDMCNQDSVWSDIEVSGARERGCGRTLQTSLDLI